MSVRNRKEDKNAAPEELLEVMDPSNRPLAVLSRTQVHFQGLYHRSVAVLAYDRNKRIYLNKRAATRVLYPGRWNLSAIGHVLAGEAVMDAAHRRLKTEVGAVPRRLKLKRVIKGCDDTNFEYVYLFSAGQLIFAPRPDPGKVQDIAFFDQKDLKEMVREFPESLTPRLVYFWRLGLIF